MTRDQFRAAWNRLNDPVVEVGPGQQEGAAGSSYYTAPVTITARGACRARSCCGGPTMSPALRRSSCAAYRKLHAGALSDTKLTGHNSKQDLLNCPGVPVAAGKCSSLIAHAPTGGTNA